CWLTLVNFLLRRLDATTPASHQSWHSLCIYLYQLRFCCRSGFRVLKCLGISGHNLTMTYVHCIEPEHHHKFGEFGEFDSLKIPYTRSRITTQTAKQVHKKYVTYTAASNIREALNK
ncbi:hypothetical protein QWA68_007392, partial [Fusarium oxysporum]